MLLAALILGGIVRPLSILLALYRTSLPMSERLYIGFIAPRGIVAVATAAYASLSVSGYEAETAVVLNLTFAIKGNIIPGIKLSIRFTRNNNWIFY